MDFGYFFDLDASAHLAKDTAVCLDNILLAAKLVGGRGNAAKTCLEFVLRTEEAINGFWHFLCGVVDNRHFAILIISMHLEPFLQVAIPSYTDPPLAPSNLPLNVIFQVINIQHHRSLSVKHAPIIGTGNFVKIFKYRIWLCFARKLVVSDLLEWV
jgi:hypothetical protein